MLSAWTGWIGRVLVCVLFTLPMGVRGEAVPGQVLVQVRPGAGGARLQGGPALQLPPGARLRRQATARGWHLVELAPGQDARSAVEWFRRRPEVSVAEPNHRYRLHGEPNDPRWPWLHGLQRIGAPAAWEVATGRSNVVVAVLDTGIDAQHPDLQSRLWRNPGEVPGNRVDDDQNGVVDDVIGADFADADADPEDDAGHGTHVAGTIGAAGNDGSGVAGVCWDVRLLTVRVGRADGFGDTFALASAFDYVVALKAAGADVRVINCSWGGGFPSVMLKEAIAAAGEAGMLVVCSAGNDRQDNDVFPAFPAGYDVPEILSVAASASCDELANFSNYGRLTVDLAAPGRDVLSTYRGRGSYQVLSGTSMAAPHVSGAAALLASFRPDLTARQLRQLLLSTVDRNAGLEGRVASGGRLNLARAMRQLVEFGPPAVAASTVPAPESRLQSVTRRTDGRWANDNSSEPSVSADGRWVVFTSAATNLVTSMDATEFVHVFLHDRRSNVTVRISQTPAGVGGRGDSGSPAISADGRHVAFVSAAGNLAGADGNGVDDVFLWSRETGRIELVSVRPDGRTAGDGPSAAPALSGDGGVVAFQSAARDLVSGDRNLQSDVFVRDRARGVTERVSVTAGGVEAVGASEAPSLSADGRYVAFHSGAANLVPGDGNRAWDVFVRDRLTGLIEIVSRADSGAIGDSDSVYPILSADGMRVAFHSAAGNFDDRGSGFIGVFVRDLLAGRLTRANAVLGEVAGGDAYVDGFSGDGRWVGFTTDDPRLAPGGAPGLYRAWLFDARTGGLGQVGVNRGGYDPDNNTFFARPSADGRVVVFTSYGSNPVADNGSGLGQVYVEDFGVARPDLTVRWEGDAGGRETGLGTVHPAVPQRTLRTVARGRTASFVVALRNLGPAQAYRLAADWPAGAGRAGWTTRADLPGTGEGFEQALFGTGWVTPVLSPGSNLVLRVHLDRGLSDAGATFASVRVTAAAATGGPILDAVTAVAESDRAPGGHELVSRAHDGAPAARNAEVGVPSRDGRWVAFSSEADHLEARGDTNFQADIFLYDRSARAVRRVSDAPSGEQADGECRYPSLSADGRWVAFQARASNLVPSDTNAVSDVFVREIETGRTILASASAEGIQGDRGSESALISADGRYVAFTSLAGNLVPGDENRSDDVFLRELESGSLQCVSRGTDGRTGNGDSQVVALSGDGRFVLFNSMAGNLSAGDTNDTMDVFVFDRVTSVVSLLSTNGQGRSANAPSRGTSISDDGRWVTFSSLATDLAAGAVPFTRNGYVLERGVGLRLAEAFFASPAAGSVARGSVVGADGRRFAVAVRRDCGDSLVFDAVATVFRTAAGGLEGFPVASSGGLGSGDDHAFPGRFDAGGRFLTIESFATTVLGEFGRGAGQVYLVDAGSPGVETGVRRGLAGAWRPAEGSAEGLAQRTLEQVQRGEGGEPAVFGFRLSNAGNVPERLVLAGVRPASGVSRVRVRALTEPPQDVTEAVFGEGWFTPVLGPGETLLCEAVVELTAPPVNDATLEFSVGWGAPRLSGEPALRFLALADRDADGLPDSWETRWLGRLDRAAMGTDSDGDGVSDQSEWEASTHPGDATSVPRLEIGRSPAVGEPTVNWRAEAGRYYQVEVSSDGAAFRAEGVAWFSADGPRAVSVPLPVSAGEGGGVVRLRVERP